MKFIIGMDVFGQLGFQLNNIPFTWPTEVVAKVKQKVEPVANNTELSEAVNQTGIAHEWKKVLEDNAKLPIGSVCKLPGSILSINTGDASPSYIQQYPIPQALTAKVKERVQTWYDNKWVKDAPAGCCWNSPILAAPKLTKD